MNPFSQHTAPTIATDQNTVGDPKLRELVKHYASITKKFTDYAIQKKLSKMGLQIVRMGAAESLSGAIFGYSALNLTTTEGDAIIANTTIDQIIDAYEEAMTVMYGSKIVDTTKAVWPNVIEKMKKSLAEGKGIISGTKDFIIKSKEEANIARELTPEDGITAFKALLIFILKHDSSEQLLVDYLHMGTPDQLHSSWLSLTDQTISIQQYAMGYMLGVPIRKKEDMKLVKGVVLETVADLLDVFTD